MNEMIKSLLMAFTFLFALYYSMLGITHILSGTMKASLMHVFTEEKEPIYINIFPAAVGILAWVIFAAEKGVFTP